ncbi:MAG: hypothetical protein ACTHKK_09460 [Candidatus Nitrosocosmicus sp.]
MPLDIILENSQVARDAGSVNYYPINVELWSYHHFLQTISKIYLIGFL